MRKPVEKTPPIKRYLNPKLQNFMSDSATSSATIEDLRKLTLKELDRIRALVEAPEKVLLTPHDLKPLLIQEVGFQRALSKLNEVNLYLAQMMKLSAVQQVQQLASLTPEEQKYIIEMPEGLRLLADHHDVVSTMGQAVGFSELGSTAKRDDYNKRATALDEENAK